MNRVPPIQAEARVREILLALEPDGQSSEAVALALALARHFTARLVTLQVENEALMRAAGLPFAFEISRHGGVERRLDPAWLERRLQDAARQLHGRLLPQAQASGITMELHSVRSRPGNVLTDYDSADIMVFGRATDTRWRRGDGVALRLEAADTDIAPFDEAARALQPALTASPWERMRWGGNADLLAQLRRRRPALVLTSRRQIVDAEQLQQLIDMLDCPIVVLR